MIYYIKHRISDNVVTEKSEIDDLDTEAGHEINMCYSPIIFHQQISNIKRNTGKPYGYEILNELKKA